MESFVQVRGIAVPMMRINIDTDQITPGHELIRVLHEGYAAALFSNLRYISGRVPNPDFILNREPWSRATILLADRNFGCGSAREHAPRAMREYGFRAMVAPSYGGIFFNNCFRNGMLPVELPIEQVRELSTQVEASNGRGEVGVNLETQLVTAPDGKTFPFVTPPLLRRMLLEGVDEIDLILSRSAEIVPWREQDSRRRPWAY
jgi:3-isopropylmalate/(R)-2-methylmalate dehydratase small subunit